MGLVIHIEHDNKNTLLWELNINTLLNVYYD